ncbi:MAG: hypothetical protein ACLQMH_13605 [Solirubrobacteraceae bacterium]
MSALVAGLAIATVLAPLAPAQAGTYVINNCPSAPTPNGDPGPWVVFGSPQLSKGSCSGGERDWIGPRGGSVSAASWDGVQVAVPSASTITIREAKVWWSVPHQVSGADNFAVAYANGAGVGESGTPGGWQAAPDVFVLPSSTTTFSLDDYCSDDDAGQPCVFGSGMNPNLELYGAQLTLADESLPTGKVTGGGLAGTGALSGTQSLAYSAEDGDSGVRLVELLIDGQPAARNDYIAQCPYANFQACPSSVSDTISWNTASVGDGQHSVEATVEDAAQNTSIMYDGTITTANAPSNTSPPSILTASQPLAGSTLSARAGEWSAPTGAGTISYGFQWQACDGQGNDCQAIPGADGSSYSPVASDLGDTVRVLVTASDNDGAASLTSAATTIVTSPATLTGLPTESTVTASSAGAPNGTGASETAQLHLAGGAAISRTFTHRALTFTGRLSSGTATQIGGATLDVLEQVRDSDSVQVIGHATTATNGTFTVHVPDGPSRTITVAYRAFSGEVPYTTQAGIQETVTAGVQMHITPRRTGSAGSIAIAGRVSGPIPRQGVVVELLVHYRGEWEPFRDPRTDSSGRFHIRYQFQGAVGRFPFRAEVLDGQSGFPYVSGASVPVYVRTD